MSSFVQKALDSAVLSKLAYFDMYNNPSGLSGIKSLSGLNKIPVSILDYISSRYNLVSQYKDVSTGYRGALFVGTAADNLGEYVFANGGSNPNIITEPAEFGKDWLSNLSLVLKGTNVQTAPMLAAFQAALGKIPSGSKLSVTGHSLGGYLSLVLADLNNYNGKIDHTYTFNAAGVDNDTYVLLVNKLLGFDLNYDPYAPVSNYYASEGLSLTVDVGFFLGDKIPVNNNGGGHDLLKLIDTFVVDNLLGTIDPSLKMGDMNLIHEAMSSSDNKDDQALLAAIGKLVLVPMGKSYKSLSDLAVGDDGLRNNYHDYAYSVLNALMSQSVNGSFPAHNIFSLVGRSADEIYSLSTTDSKEQFGGFEVNRALAIRYALKELNSFVWSDGSYKAFDDQYRLERSESSDYKLIGAMSGFWLKDRAEMLGNYVRANINDVQAVVLTKPGLPIVYFDQAKNVKLIAQAMNSPDPLSSFLLGQLGDNVFSVLSSARRIFYADDGKDVTFGGGSLSDHLYGGYGSDKISGYLEPVSNLNQTLTSQLREQAAE